MEPVTLVLLGIAAFIHVLPLSGVLGAARLEALYGVPIDEPNLLLAMRHRAVMFGALGGFLVAAMAVPTLRPGAIVVTLVCDAAFMMLALQTEGLNPKMRRVLVADVISVACLAAAFGLTRAG